MDFGDYARVCFELFGDRVKHWITLNEPHETADEGYGFGWMAPGIYGPGLFLNVRKLGLFQGLCKVTLS